MKPDFTEHVPVRGFLLPVNGHAGPGGTFRRERPIRSQAVRQRPDVHWRGRVQYFATQVVVLFIFMTGLYGLAWTIQHVANVIGVGR